MQPFYTYIYKTKETKERETLTRKQLFHVGLAYRDTW